MQRQQGSCSEPQPVLKKRPCSVVRRVWYSLPPQNYNNSLDLSPRVGKPFLPPGGLQEREDWRVSNFWWWQWGSSPCWPQRAQAFPSFHWPEKAGRLHPPRIPPQQAWLSPRVLLPSRRHPALPQLPHSETCSRRVRRKTWGDTQNGHELGHKDQTECEECGTAEGRNMTWDKRARKDHNKINTIARKEQTHLQMLAPNLCKDNLSIALWRGLVLVNCWSEL